MAMIRDTVLRSLISEHRGRLIKLTGDGLLVKIASVVDAVDCATAWQRAITSHETGRPKDGRIVFRIGVDHGDVVVEDEDIYGDGVNVAARLEALAAPGGICLPVHAWRQVRGRVEATFDDMG